ncbi:hypothetical protein A9G11_10070 [Gilliamella sp. wkB108]|uniref:GyrI-like domain-containing protein n=1 Tax=Gilliamella sp. wkB108 TaxID=3120256 RepID=UPI00080E367A|nr:GyrI-like domain-containing protein [Gilliamella apicola]OCG28786.1 hypothetical protein A9G11_10070 [Gilliamella apicola]
MDEMNMHEGLDYKIKEGIPKISDMPMQQVVSIDVIGDPNTETSKLMKPLYTAAYGVRKIYKANGHVFKVDKLRGRWPQINMVKNKSDWIGTYALPLPNDVTNLPTSGQDIDNVKLEQWQYGKVAYILHVGSYANEGKTIEILLDYISSNGMKIIENSHEEIYLSDPTKTDRDKLKTIILYRICPK